MDGLCIVEDDKVIPTVETVYSVSGVESESVVLRVLMSFICLQKALEKARIEWESAKTVVEELVFKASLD
ncbi:hypothetical protein Tco_0967440 [Tanacetum coccineum]